MQECTVFDAPVGLQYKCSTTASSFSARGGACTAKSWTGKSGDARWDAEGSNHHNGGEEEEEGEEEEDSLLWLVVKGIGQLIVFILEAA